MPGTAGKFELHTPSVDWSTESAGYFWTTAKASFIEENVAQKFAVLLGRPTLLLFVYCAHSSFYWIY